MNSTKSDYQNINLIVQSITTKEEKDYTYVTLDGFKGFTFPCPICSPDGKRKTAKIFPKRVEDWKGDYPKKWFYLCKGAPNCSCKGRHSLDYFISKYMGQK